MNAAQINAIGLEINRLQKERESIYKEISKLKQKIIIIDKDIDQLSEGIQKVRGRL